MLCASTQPTKVSSPARAAAKVSAQPLTLNSSTLRFPTSTLRSTSRQRQPSERLTRSSDPSVCPTSISRHTSPASPANPLPSAPQTRSTSPSSPPPVSLPPPSTPATRSASPPRSFFRSSASCRSPRLPSSSVADVVALVVERAADVARPVAAADLRDAVEDAERRGDVASRRAGVVEDAAGPEGSAADVDAVKRCREATVRVAAGRRATVWGGRLVEGGGEGFRVSLVRGGRGCIICIRAMHSVSASSRVAQAAAARRVSRLRTAACHQSTIGRDRAQRATMQFAQQPTESVRYSGQTCLTNVSLRAARAQQACLERVLSPARHRVHGQSGVCSTEAINITSR